MRCRDVRKQLSIYRELNPVEQGRLQQHVSGCPACAASWAAYQAQDRLFSALVPIIPSPDLGRGVRSRLAAVGHPVLRLVWGRLVVTVVALLVFFSGAGYGVVSASVDSLPGDSLYPVKRMVEQIRLAATLDPGSRLSYEQYLEEMRREEVREITRLERQVRVQFRGCLESVENDVWVVGGIGVRVGPAIWPNRPPVLASEILIEAQVAGGRLVAYRVAIGQALCSTPEPLVTPRPSLSPGLSRTPKPSLSPRPSRTPKPSLSPGPSPTRVLSSSSTPLATLPGKSIRTPRGPEPEGTATRRGGGPAPTTSPSEESPLDPTPTRTSQMPGYPAGKTPTAEPGPGATRTPGGGGQGDNRPPTAPPPSGPAVNPTRAGGRG